MTTFTRNLVRESDEAMQEREATDKRTGGQRVYRQGRFFCSGVQAICCWYRANRSVTRAPPLRGLEAGELVRACGDPPDPTAGGGVRTVAAGPAAAPVVVGEARPRVVFKKGLAEGDLLSPGEVHSETGRARVNGSLVARPGVSCCTGAFSRLERDERD